MSWSAADRLQIRPFGRGAHGSMPQAGTKENVITGVEALVVGALAWLC